MKNALLMATAFLALAVGAQQTLAQERTVRFLCHAPTGHTCQYRVRTAAGPVDFALPSGERREAPASLRWSTNIAYATPAR
jgi:hypothetical protein